MPNREQRRALKVLADAPRGVTEEMLVVVHGFSGEMIANLVLAGLTTVVSTTKNVPSGPTVVPFARPEHSFVKSRYC